MSLVRSAALALISTLASALVPGRALAQSSPADAGCATAYAKGQDDRSAGRLYAARTAFLSCSAPRCPAAVASDCQRWAREVEADLPTMIVRAIDASGQAIPGLLVTIDGVGIPSEQLARPLVLEAGPHSLHFEAPGFAPLELERALRPTDREIAVSALLAPPAPAAPPVSPKAEHPLPTASIALAGVGVVALAGSAYFGLRARSQYDDLKASCAPNCSPASADEVRRKSLIADVALITSLAAFGAAAWLYFGAPSEPPKAAWFVAPRPDGALSGLSVSF